MFPPKEDGNDKLTLIATPPHGKRKFPRGIGIWNGRRAHPSGETPFLTSERGTGILSHPIPSRPGRISRQGNRIATAADLGGTWVIDRRARSANRDCPPEQRKNGTRALPLAPRRGRAAETGLQARRGEHACAAWAPRKQGEWDGKRRAGGSGRAREGQREEG
jgi:hypothetical protein